MFRKATLAIGLAALALLSSSTNAAPGWGPPLTVASLIPNESGLTIVVAGNSSNPMGCGSPSWLQIKTGDANFALVSSAMLTAFAQGKAIKVWQDACQPDGSVHFRAVWIDQ